VSLKIHAGNCSGCRLCELLCSLKNFGENAPARSRLRVIGKFPMPGHYEICICDQCGICATECPSGAISLVDGFYRVDAELCTNCGTCIGACPRKAIFEDPVTAQPQMCSGCGECFEYCPLKVFELQEEVNNVRV